jgi:hypothetical protein
MLNSDELGEKGEHQFGQICADARLVANKSTRDRTGWDYIVEFNFEDTTITNESLEKRQKPLSCHVQVKTIWDRNDRIEMRLSSAEHLAKELKPAFIYVQKVNDKLEFTGAYLIHVLDEPLAKILKRLRKEDIAGATASNDKKMYMTAATNGVPLAPTGAALRDGIITACGSDLRAYADKKSAQLKTLGYEGKPFELKMSLALNNIEDLVDAFLGLKDKVPAKDLKSHETRFGLKKKLEERSDSSAIISIQPQVADTCTITVRSIPLSTPGVFKGDVFFPAIPNLPDEHRKMLIKNELFHITFMRSSWSVSLHSDIPSQKISTWAAYWRFCYAMKSGTGTIRIKSDNNPIDATLNITEQAEGGFEAAYCKFFYELCDKTLALLQLAGMNGEPVLSMKDLFDQRYPILRLDLLASPSKGKFPLKFTSETGNVTQSSFTLDMLYIDWIRIADVTLGFFAVGKMTGLVEDAKIEWTTDNVELKSIIRLHNLPNDLEKMTESAKAQTGCQNIWLRQWYSADEEGAGEPDDGEMLFQS